MQRPHRSPTRRSTQYGKNTFAKGTDMQAPTFFLFAPQGAGKSSKAAQIAALLGCTSIVDDWRPGQPYPDGALVLSNANPAEQAA